MTKRGMAGIAQKTTPCQRCDGQPGSKETYANQVVLPLNGRTVCVDWCIHHIVAALNAGGIETIACCCGHGQQPGRIDLADGRVLRIETKEYREKEPK